MSRFLVKLTVFLFLALSLLSLLLIEDGGYVDYFYEKFTTPKTQSMILGDSRSMQGIQPSVINSYFRKGEYATPILNYSFTVAQMAYGEIWKESIVRKLDTTSGNGLFILTVNPWILSKRDGDDESKKVFFEADVPPNNMKFVSMNPNFEYLIKNWNYFHFKSIFRKTSEMHKDGWLEESNLTNDQNTLDEWKQNQVNIFSGFSHKMQPSQYRLTEFNNLVKYLNTKGHVFIVRMPMDSVLIEIEAAYWASFDSDIEKVAEANGVKYFNFTKDKLKYRTYDGNHLDKYGGVVFTKDLCDSISVGMISKK